jgi:hypothetical protein
MAAELLCFLLLCLLLQLLICGPVRRNSTHLYAMRFQGSPVYVRGFKASVSSPAGCRVVVRYPSRQHKVTIAVAIALQSGYRELITNNGLIPRTRDNMASPRPRSSLPPQSMLPRDEPGSANSQYSQHPIDPYHTPREYKPHAQRYYAAVSSDTSAKLFQTYFASIHPIWPILYKPSYAALDHSSPTATMPAALIAAIYCIASSVERPSQSSSSAILHRYSEPQQFFDEALDLIQQDSNQGEHAVNTFTPSITNCQVLAILALQQHGVAEYARASMLCGLASAMAIELRLHRPSSPNNTVQAEVRSRLWWNLFILEHKLSCEMAHPAILRIEETDTPFPSVSEADEFELLFVPTPSHQDRGISVKARTISVLETTIQLSIITERISREVYSLSARKAIRHDSKLGQQKRMDLWGVIQNWERDVMASPLRLDLSESFASIPGTVINHVVSTVVLITMHILI